MKKAVTRIIFSVPMVVTGDTTHVDVGFRPAKVTAFANLADTDAHSIAIQTGIDQVIIVWQILNGFVSTGFNTYGHICKIQTTTSISITGVITAYDDTGFTITWTKTGDISGTLVMEILAEAQ